MISTSKSPPSKLNSVCETCGFDEKSPGYLRADVPVGHPAFGTIIPCPTCFAAKQKARHQRHAALRSLDQIEGWLKTATFDSYRVTDANRAAYNAALAFARQPIGLLTLQGSYGVGKTHLLAAVANYLTANSIPSLYTTLPDLVSKHRAAVGNNWPEEFYRHFSRYQVLLIDEINMVSLKNWTREQVFRLFNHRYNNFDTIGTVLAFNPDQGGLSELDYLFSRLSDDRATRVTISGKDNRPRTTKINQLLQLVRLKGQSSHA